jgi:hypothetical protein
LPSVEWADAGGLVQSFADGKFPVNGAEVCSRAAGNICRGRRGGLIRTAADVKKMSKSYTCKKAYHSAIYFVADSNSVVWLQSAAWIQQHRELMISMAEIKPKPLEFLRWLRMVDVPREQYF